MEGPKSRQVKLSVEFIHDLDEIYQYGVETFGQAQAEHYEEVVLNLVESLAGSWNLFGECRHLRTRSKIYRWIILESHLLIYRITPTEIQMLRALHSRRSLKTIKSTRRIKID
jgi:plasmid stabilization system protein ParE